jgi:hypothetical protein
MRNGTHSLTLLQIVLVGFLCQGVAQAQWTTNGNHIYNTNSGGVGIGTSSPNHTLEVNGSILAHYYIAVRSSSAAFLSYDRQGDSYGILGLYRDNGLNRLWDNNAGDVIVFDSSGKVGIGTSTPSTRLHVSGDLTVSGNIAAKYQDLAEWVPASEPIPPATLVVLDKQRTNSVLPSSKAYDPHVAGVVSSLPGIVLGEAGEGRVKVATTGRVKVRVDATVAPIAVGDLLVTSDKSGMAMRSKPVDIGGVEIHRPGTLVGKALEPLADGEGEILVLLSLQ